MTQKKKKKNRLWGLVTAVAALAALIGVYFLIPQEDAAKDQGAQADQALTWESLAAFSRIVIENGESLAFSIDDEEWALEAEPQRPIDQTLLQEMVTVLSGLTPVRLIEAEPEDLSVYGLEDTAVQIKAGEAQIRLGAVNPVSGDRYVLWTDGKVYTAAANDLEVFSLNLVELTAMETLPDITSADVTSLKVMDKDGTEKIALTHLDAPKAEDPTQTYLWYVTQDGVTRAAKDTQAQSLTEKFVGLTLGACVEYQSDETILAQYGLDEPSFVIEVEYAISSTASDGSVTRGKAQTFRLEVGRIDADGTAYVRFDDCEGIYTANGSTLTNAVLTEAQDLWPTDWITLSSSDLSSMNLVTRGSYLEFVFRDVEETDEEGNSTTSREILLNGTEVTSGDFAFLYSSLASLTVENRVIGAEAQSEDSVLTLRLQVGAEPLVVKLLPYDNSFYLADMNGTRELLLNRREVDAFCDEAIEFLVTYSQTQDESSEGE